MRSFLVYLAISCALVAFVGCSAGADDSSNGQRKLQALDYNGKPDSCNGPVRGGFPGLDYCCGPLNCRDGKAAGYGPTPGGDNCAAECVAGDLCFYIYGTQAGQKIQANGKPLCGTAHPNGLDGSLQFSWYGGKCPHGDAAVFDVYGSPQAFIDAKKHLAAATQCCNEDSNCLSSAGSSGAGGSGSGAGGSGGSTAGSGGASGSGGGAGGSSGGSVCPSGNGLYCGAIADQDPDSLYRCTAGVYSFVGVCSNGCQTNPPGQNDACKSAASSGTCPSGNGLYCGGNGVAGDSNTLYQCTGGALSIAQVCANGCRPMPPGTNDQCASAPTPSSCPSGDGLYCGAIAGQDPDSLYRCTAGVYSFVGVCSNGCQTNPPGQNDACYPDSGTCPSGNGLYCGGNGVAGDSNTLYQCTGGALSIAQVCANGCRPMPPGQNDVCG